MDEHIASLLQSTLSPDSSVRVQAELGIAEASRHGESCLSLARITLAQHADISLRQSAVFILKKYVREHWSIAFETFKGDPPSQEIKSQVREAVFAGLPDPNRKVRLGCANVISEMASSDWPDEWPGLLDSLLQLLSSGEANSVHGAMRVMTDFVSDDLSEDQLLPLASAILPQLLQILGNEAQYSAITRSQGVSVFKQCLSTLYMVKENHPQAAEYATQQVLPQWIDAFRQLLSIDIAANGSWDSLFVRHDVYQTLSTILVSFPRSLSSNMAEFIVDGLRDLTNLMPHFRSQCLEDDAEPTFSLDNEEGISLSISQYASSIFDFVGNASRKKSGAAALLNKAEGQVTDLTREAIYLAFYYAQIPSEDEERWQEDMNAFVADEDDEIPAATLRTACLDFVNGLANSFETPVLAALHTAESRMLAEAEKQRQHGAVGWWKEIECCLTQIAGLAEEVTEQTEQARASSSRPAYDIEQVFGSLVVPYLAASDLPYLQGRALIFASRFATLLPEHLQQQFFEQSLHAFESQEVGLIVKISALRALKNFCQELPDSNLFASYATRITANLVPIASQASGATLILILDTMQRTLALGTVQQDESLCQRLIAVLLQPVHSGAINDPLLSSALCDLFRSLSQSSEAGVYKALVSSALPELSRIITVPETEATRSQIGAAMTILNSIFDGRPSPLGQGFFAAAADALFTAMARTEDDGVLQEGLECLTFVVRKDVQQLLQWQSPSGANGISSLFSVIARVLEPSRSESGGLFVGDLVLHVFRKAGEHVLPVLPSLLQACVTRLSTARTSTFSQSLILPFAYLIHTQADTVLELLESIFVDGKSGVETLLSSWVDLTETLMGFWNIKVSTVALANLLLSRRPSVNGLSVKGDLVVNQNNSGAILTRSRSRKTPDQYTTIPFRVKAMKILLKELEQSTEPLDPATAEFEEAEDDGNWEDDEISPGAKNAIDLTRFMGGVDASFLQDNEDDSLDDDEDLQSDPIYTLDIPKHVRQTLQALATNDRASYDAFATYLNHDELHTLHSI